MNLPSLRTFLAARRNDDEKSADGALRALEPLLRKVIRVRLNAERMRGVVDTTEILNSVVAKLLSPRTASRVGKLAPDEQEAFVVRMLINKIKENRRRRRPTDPLPSDEELPAVESTADTAFDGRELLDKIRSRLPQRVRELFDLKRQGLTWPQIAERVGQSADTLRRRLTLAIAHVKRGLRS